ncbi:MAG: RNA polymerase sigma factor [Gaiellales bacterium]
MSRDARLLAQIESVYRSRGADFYRFTLARAQDPERARDAVQEGFARAIRSRRTFRGSGSLEAWIGRCVINAARDLTDDITTTSLKEAPASETLGDSLDEVREAVRRLPPRQRDALFLRYYLDFDYAMIAEVLEVEIGTVSATLHAARNGLLRSFEEVS